MPPSRACCAHDHDCEAADCGVAYSLYKHVSIDQVRCLNEATPGSARAVLRPWHTRAQALAAPLRSHGVDGDDDEQPELLLHIPFDGAVKLKAISVVNTGEPGAGPATLAAYTNREGLDFATAAALPPVQTWELQPDGTGLLEYPTQVSRFNGVHCLDLLLRGSVDAGAGRCEVTFIGLKGEFVERKRQAVEAVYEARPVPGDQQKIPGIGDGAHWHT